MFRSVRSGECIFSFSTVILWCSARGQLSETGLALLKLPAKFDLAIELWLDVQLVLQRGDHVLLLSGTLQSIGRFGHVSPTRVATGKNDARSASNAKIEKVLAAIRDFEPGLMNDFRWSPRNSLRLSMMGT